MAKKKVVKKKPEKKAKKKASAKERKSEKLSTRETAAKLLYKNLVTWHENLESEVVKGVANISRMTDKRMEQVKSHIGKLQAGLEKRLVKYFDRRGL